MGLLCYEEFGKLGKKLHLLLLGNAMVSNEGLICLVIQLAEEGNIVFYNSCAYIPSQKIFPKRGFSIGETYVMKNQNTENLA